LKKAKAQQQTVQKPFSEWSYTELTDYVGGRLSVGLFNGKFHDEVRLMCHLVLDWAKGQSKEEK